jgi:hypothetical protein
MIRPDTLYRIDWAKLFPEVQQGLLDGSARIIKGVVRNSGDMNQILQHVPFVPVDVESTGDLLSRAKSATGLAGAAAATPAALALSTVVIVGAIVVSTAYLAGKIEEVQEGIARIEATLESQARLDHIRSVSHYLGAVGRTREILCHPAIVAENPDLLIQALAQLGQERHSFFSLVDSLFTLLPSLPPSELRPALEFLHSGIDFLPKAAFLESQAAFQLERFHFGLEVLQTSQAWHEKTVSAYRHWGQAELRTLVHGTPSPASKILAPLREQARQVLGAEENRLLLEYSV